MTKDRTTLFLRGMPAALVRETKAAAARRGSTLTDLVSRSLERSLGGEGWTEGRADDGLREGMRWYRKNREELLRRYRGEYIAVMDGAVVDHDRDFEALAARVFTRVPDRSIFMPRVQEEEARARVRSPRRRR